MLSRDHELAIDLIRGGTALLVLVAHLGGPVLEPAFGANYHAWPPALQVLGFTADGARFWVRFFFVISGFCIQQSVSRSLERGGFDLGHYVLARLTRIYPVFLIGLALAVANWWINASTAFPLKELAGSLLMLQNFTGSFPACNPSWSLTPEVFYYAAWPLAVIGCGGRQRTAVSRAAWTTLLLTLLIVAFWKINLGGDPSHWLVTAWVISGLFVVWLGGAWLAIEWRTVQSWITPRIWVLGIAWVLAMFLTECLLVLYHARTWPFMLTDYLAIPGMAILIAGGHFCRISASPRWTAFARWMGTLSYPCYLLHLVIFDLLRGAVKSLPLPIHPLLQTVLVLILTLVIIGTLGVALERSFMRWRSRYLKALTPRAEGGAPSVAT